MYDTWQDGYGTTVFVVHVPEDCEGRPCTIHHPSNHGMTGLKQRWNNVDKYMERVCPHGVGHTDPDEIRRDHVVHGCDGCCKLFLGDDQ